MVLVAVCITRRGFKLALIQRKGIASLYALDVCGIGICLVVDSGSFAQDFLGQDISGCAGST